MVVSEGICTEVKGIYERTFYHRAHRVHREKFLGLKIQSRHELTQIVTKKEFH